MSGALGLLLLAALGASASSGRPAAPMADSNLGADRKMERIEPQAKDLLKAGAKLLSLQEAYAKGGDPDDPALGRAAVRAAVQSALDRVQASVGEFWHMAEALRVTQSVGFLTDTMAGKKPDAGKAAASILQTPVFPKVVMSLHQMSLLALIYDERAYVAAKLRRKREMGIRAMFAAGGLALGALAALFIYGAAGGGPGTEAALPSRPTPRPPARLE